MVRDLTRSNSVRKPYTTVKTSNNIKAINDSGRLSQTRSSDRNRNKAHFIRVLRRSDSVLYSGVRRPPAANAILIASHKGGSMESRGTNYLDALFDAFGGFYSRPMSNASIYRTVERVFRKHGKPIPSNFEAAVRAELQNHPTLFENVKRGYWQLIPLAPPPPGL